LSSCLLPLQSQVATPAKSRTPPELREWLKHFRAQVLAPIFRNAKSVPFRKPVDAVALGIYPIYFQVPIAFNLILFRLYSKRVFYSNIIVPNIDLHLGVPKQTLQMFDTILKTVAKKSRFVKGFLTKKINRCFQSRQPLQKAYNNK
jgi:hypothetical protein